MQINPFIVFRREFDATGIIFNPESGESYVLNPVAVLIWELLSGGCEETELAARLRPRLRQTPATLDADVGEFVTVLRDKGYVSSL